jgi:MYXO-CTERM domain-containing protein
MRKTMTHSQSRLLRLLATAAFLTSAVSASALPEYPRRIKSTLGLDYAPPCSICHENGQTGDGTPIEPFAWSMRARGLTDDESTLAPALSADQSDLVDSDGDGITDVKELENGTDLNSVANDCIIPPGTTITAGQCTPAQASPTLGCGIASPSASPRERIAYLTLAVFFVAAVSRRRRRAR